MTITFRTSDEKIDGSIAFMRANLRAGLSVPELARHAGVSPSHFWRRFRRATGLSPYAVLTQLRMERTRELLTGTQMELKEISDEVGYKTASAFGRVFARVCGENAG